MLVPTAVSRQGPWSWSSGPLAAPGPPHFPPSRITRPRHGPGLYWAADSTRWDERPQGWEASCSSPRGGRRPGFQGDPRSRARRGSRSRRRSEPRRSASPGGRRPRGFATAAPRPAGPGPATSVRFQVPQHRQDASVLSVLRETQLHEHRPYVRLDGPLGHDELLGDGRVGQAFGNPAEDVELAT